MNLNELFTNWCVYKSYKRKFYYKKRRQRHLTAQHETKWKQTTKLNYKTLDDWSFTELSLCSHSPSLLVSPTTSLLCLINFKSIYIQYTWTVRHCNTLKNESLRFFTTALILPPLKKYATAFATAMPNAAAN